MTSVHVTCIIRCPHLYQKQQSPQAPSRRPYAVAMLRRSPCTSDPHTGHVPIRFRGFSIQPPKILTLVSTRPAFPTPQIRHPPVSANAHPANSLKFPAPTRGAWASGCGAASRCDVGVAVEACTQAGPKVGACGLGARILGESGQAGLDKSPQTRRRIAQDG